MSRACRAIDAWFPSLIFAAGEVGLMAIAAVLVVRSPLAVLPRVRTLSMLPIWGSGRLEMGPDRVAISAYCTSNGSFRMRTNSSDRVSISCRSTFLFCTGFVGLRESA
jgi:hypothetical protein